MKRKTLVFIYLILGVLLLEGQVPGVTKNGSHTSSDTSYLDQFGGDKRYPRLNRNGHILYYAPNVRTDSSVFRPEESAGFLYGNIPFDGWDKVSSRGFDYSQSPDFTSSTRLVSPGQLGVFSDTLHNLTRNQTYYIRAYATNGYGTSYGDTMSFVVPCMPVIIDTTIVEQLTPTTALFITTLLDNGGADVRKTVKCWSIDPLVVDSQEVNDNGYYSTLQISSSLRDLYPGTDYRLRTIVLNDTYADTSIIDFHTPTDLSAAITKISDSISYPCDSGVTFYYQRTFTGTDLHISDFQTHWTSSGGSLNVMNDSTCSISYFRNNIYDTIRIEGIRGPDTVRAALIPPIRYTHERSTILLCTNEFTNTGDLTCTNIASVRWIDSLGNEVSAAMSVQLPTGNYIIEHTDIYGCTQTRDAYIGKLKLSCPIVGEPLPNESARWANGIWHVDSVADHEGNWYAVTGIGNQCWLRQNMRVLTSPTTGFNFYNGLDNLNPKAIYTGNQYDPKTFPYSGMVYNWAAAMDTSSLYLSSAPTPRRGICPQGWHLPVREEVATLCETTIHERFPEMIITPPFTFFNERLGANTPIIQMLNETCYETSTDHTYEKDVYDFSHMSLHRNPYNNTNVTGFWEASPEENSNLGFWFKIYNQYVSHTYNTKSNYLPVRCVRD